MEVQHWEIKRKDPAFVVAMRELCLSNFRVYCESVFQFVLRKEFIWSFHHAVIEDALMRMWSGDSSWRNLIINMPPRYGKTEMFCLFTSWAYAHNPACENLHLSFADNLVRRNSLKIKQYMKSQFYCDLFETRIDQNKDAVEEWRTTGGGLFYASSTSGQVTGSGAGAISEEEECGEFKFSGFVWIDDPQKPKDANTVRREQVNELWHDTIKSRRNAQTTPVACCMQRIHEGDFTAELMSDTFEAFRRIKLKALSDKGEALWPFKHSVKALISMKETRLHVYSSQYQQDPTPKGGSIFLSHWWRYEIREPDSFDRVIITADTASKTKERHDFSVFQCWGRSEGRIYLLDQIRGKWEAPQLKTVAVEFIKQCKKRYPKMYKMHVEDKASGTGLIQSMPALTSVPVVGIQRNIDKATRADDAAPHVQSGQVVLIDGKPFNEIFVSECTGFNKEDTHLHDDQVDPMMDAVEILLGGSGNNIGFLAMA